MLASCSTEYFFSFNSADDFLSGQSNVYLRDVHIFVCNRLYAVVLKPCIVNLFCLVDYLQCPQEILVGTQ